MLMDADRGEVERFVGTRAYYQAAIDGFLADRDELILAALTEHSTFAIDLAQRDAWTEQVRIMREALRRFAGDGEICFEFGVPRVGRRIDVLAVIRHVIFVFEFKVGARSFARDAVEQVWDYALDLKNFHSTTHEAYVAPILIATQAAAQGEMIRIIADADRLLHPILAAPGDLAGAIERILSECDAPRIDLVKWSRGRYRPTPTIIEAAMALYSGHSVSDISRNDASAVNLSCTSEAIAEIIRSSCDARRKSICFVTGVPGAGKTLVGLDVATRHVDKRSSLYSVYLSGNAPLVAVLREALVRDKVRRDAANGVRSRKGQARSEVQAFIQNVHHFRDDCLVDMSSPPVEHVTLFDEAQRAWNREQTAAFMHRKKKRPGFNVSEPEFLISCMDRHDDWAVVVCLVGGGQEINTGEAGIGEWMRALHARFPHWDVHIPPHLHDSEYAADGAIELIKSRRGVSLNPALHLSVSMRSFRSERVSELVKSILDLNLAAARELLPMVSTRYPIALTRNLRRAKAWLRERARGSERYGLVVSSQAQRLKPHAIDVRAKVDPVHWFLDPPTDVRSSLYLEDAATEFQVQGLELDWVGVVWDADFRHTPTTWNHWSFRGERWNRIRQPSHQTYLKNAYRVLLTRARQGLIIVVPEGDPSDPTRGPALYDATFEYLKSIGLTLIA